MSQIIHLLASSLVRFNYLPLIPHPFPHHCLPAILHNTFLHRLFLHHHSTFLLCSPSLSFTFSLPFNVRTYSSVFPASPSWTYIGQSLPLHTLIPLASSRSCNPPSPFSLSRQNSLVFPYTHGQCMVLSLQYSSSSCCY